MFDKLRYGLASAISQLDQEPSDRIDPMSEVTFQKPPSTMPIVFIILQCPFCVRSLNMPYDHHGHLDD